MANSHPLSAVDAVSGEPWFQIKTLPSVCVATHCIALKQAIPDIGTPVVDGNDHVVPSAVEISTPLTPIWPTAVQAWSVAQETPVSGDCSEPAWNCGAHVEPPLVVPTMVPWSPTAKQTDVLGQLIEKRLLVVPDVCADQLAPPLLEA
jgi:hypothetical protein